MSDLCQIGNLELNQNREAVFDRHFRNRHNLAFNDIITAARLPAPFGV